MPAPRKSREQTLHISTLLVASYRATLDFFAERDKVMKKFHPSPFPHWLRGEGHFNLISAETRRVIRFEPKQFIVRAEGHSTLDTFEEMILIAKELVAAFGISDLFAMMFTSVRSRAMRSLEEARSTFAKDFLTGKTLRLLTTDALTDFAVVVERNWLSNTEFQQVRPGLARLQVKEHVTAGPVSHNEIGKKWTEFRRDAENKLYVTDHVSPKFAILADIKFGVDRNKGVESLRMDTLWKFYEWAKGRADNTWLQMEG